MASASVPTLRYFGIAGRAEFIKLLFEDAKKPYNFEPVGFGQHKNSPVKELLAFGQLPVYQEGDFTLVQTGAIVRYVARKLNQAPHQPHHVAVADMFLEGSIDLTNKYFSAAFGDDAAKENFKNVVLPLWLGYFEALLTKHATHEQGLVENRFTYADVALFVALDFQHRYLPDVFKNFPACTAFHKKIASRPNIADYLAARRPK